MMTTYRMNDMYSCIQGEGCLTGQSMVLLRLQGCGVGCPWCDTKETWVNNPRHRVDSLEEALGVSPKWAEVGPNLIARAARDMAPAIPWALVTGGEPAEQDLSPLRESLRVQGFKVAIETSGTALGHSGCAFDWVCVSPKINMPGGRKVLAAAVSFADEIKHVVGKPEDIADLDELLALVELKPSCQISLQPVSGSQPATALCLAAVKERGWRLSIQIHKFLNER